MNCPVDDEILQMTERQGVEVDYCPRCRGVWLDRGELDKILERASVELAGADERQYEERDRHDAPRPNTKKKKKTSFLSEMFEFGGD